MSRRVVAVCLASILLPGCVSTSPDEDARTSPRRAGGLRTPNGAEIPLLDGPSTIRFEGTGLQQAVVEFARPFNLTALTHDAGQSNGTLWVLVAPHGSWFGPVDGSPCAPNAPDVLIWTPTLEYQRSGPMADSFAAGTWLFLVYNRDRGFAQFEFGEQVDAPSLVLSKPATDYATIELSAEPTIADTPTGFTLDFKTGFDAPGEGFVLARFSVSGGTPPAIYATAQMSSEVKVAATLCSATSDGSMSPIENVFRAPVTASIGEAGTVSWSGHFDSGLKRDASNSNIVIEGFFLH